MYKCVFYAHRHFFPFRPRSFLVFSAPAHAGSSPEHHGASMGPGRGPWHVIWGSKSQQTTGRHCEHVVIQAHANTYRLKECPTAHVISRILNVVNVIRHYSVMERYFPRHQLARHATTFSTIINNLHDLGRIVSSHARSCVEDMTTRWLDFHLRPTAVRV